MTWSGICGVRVAVGDSSVAEGRRWRKPYPYMHIPNRTYTEIMFRTQGLWPRQIEHDWTKRMFIDAFVRSWLCTYVYELCVKETHWAFGVKMTSDQRRCDVIDVNTTSFWHQMPAGKQRIRFLNK